MQCTSYIGEGAFKQQSNEFEVFIRTYKNYLKLEISIFYEPHIDMWG